MCAGCMYIKHIWLMRLLTSNWKSGMRNPPQLAACLRVWVLAAPCELLEELLEELPEEELLELPPLL